MRPGAPGRLPSAARSTEAAVEPVAERVWELRRNLTCYDAWYVAIAEALDLPLATLDELLSRASGPACRFLVAG